MKVIGMVWRALTEGERMSALDYARELTEKRWKGVGKCGK